MADWRDGVEYAPTGRPYGFATPRSEPLTGPEPEQHLADGRPDTPPAEFDAPVAPPLEDLVPHTAEPRDPRTAFDTASASFTGATAWGAVGHHGPGAWVPTQPLGRSSDTAPTGTDFAPPTGAPVVPAGGAAVPPPLTPAPPAGQAPPGYPPPAGYPPPSPYPPPAGPPTGNGWGPQGQARHGQPLPGPPGQAGTPARPDLMGWLLISLLLAGAVIQSLSILLLAAAAIVVRRVRPRRAGLVTAVSIGAGTLVPVMALAWAAQPYDWFATASSVSQVACFVLLIAATITLSMGSARR